MAFTYAFASVLIVSLVSFVGVAALYFSRRGKTMPVMLLVALAAGALFGDVFFHLLPEAFETSGDGIGVVILLGLLLFFVLEKFLHWQHRHGPHDHSDVGGVAPVGSMVLFSDGVHNFIDGVIIAASYLVSVPVGLATTIAVVLHEIPQELGDFGILVHAGFEKKRALLYNFLSALAAFLGVLTVFVFGGSVVRIADLVIPIAIGGFLYIAGSDLVPELHKTRTVGQSIAQLVAVVIGIALMFGLTLLE